MMKRLFLAALFGAILCSAMTLSAKRVFNRGDALPGVPSTEVVKAGEKSPKQSAIASKTIGKKKVQTPSKADEQLCEVKCVFKYNHDVYEPYVVNAYNPIDSSEEYYDWENDYVYLYLTPGLYDFRTEYNRISETSIFGEMGTAYLILEDIEVNEDMEIELDASLITEVISFETYNPDGEKTALRYIRYLNEDYDWEIITEYNVYDIYVDNFIMREGYPSYSMHANAAGVEVESGPCGEWKAEWVSNIYINPVSDKYQLSQLRMLYNEKECWIVPMFADGSKTQTVTNKDDKYSDLYNVTFSKTPAGKDCEVVSDGPYDMHWSMSDFYGKESSWGLQSTIDSFHHFRFCPTTSSLKHPDYICYMSFDGEDSAEIGDVYKDYDDEGNLIYEQVEYNRCTVSTPDLVLGLESCEAYPGIDNRFLNMMPAGMEMDNYFRRPLGYKVYPQDMPVFNSTPQFMQFYYLTYESEWYDYPYPIIDFTSCGYYGEHRDYAEGDIEISVNGNVVAKSAEELYQWQEECLESPIMGTGNLVFSYSNSNIEVDGLAGSNTAKVCIDTSAENFSMPLIQSVRFRDEEGNVKFRFEDASQGKLEIYGGDFREMKGAPNLINGFGESPMWYEVKNCDLTVECAPYGSNDYQALEMNQDGESVIAFGLPFEGSLENVEAKSATGWFDLRITMTDTAGNSQEQIISPAFQIEELSGVQKVNINMANLRVVGKRIVSDFDNDIEVYTLAGQKVENKNLVNGIYVAMCGDSIAKLIVK